MGIELPALPILQITFNDIGGYELCDDAVPKTVAPVLWLPSERAMLRDSQCQMREMNVWFYVVVHFIFGVSLGDAVKEDPRSNWWTLRLHF